MRIQVFIALTCVIALAGCAGIQHSMQYNDVKHVVFSHPSLPHEFWIFDKPDENRMLINTGLRASMGQGLAKGATFGLADTSTPVQAFREAAQLFLDRSGRECDVSRVDRIVAPTNYEAFYACKSLGEASLPEVSDAQTINN